MMMPSELQLIRIGRLGTIISILSSILFLISADESEQIQLCKDYGKTPPEFHPTPAEIVFAGILIGTLSSYISYEVAKARLEQLKKESHANVKQVSLEPNIFIVNGILLSVVGGILSSIGVFQKIKQEQNIVII